MTPNNPKQAYCTKFLLRIRTQPPVAVGGIKERQKVRIVETRSIEPHNCTPSSPKRVAFPLNTTPVSFPSFQRQHGVIILVLGPHHTNHSNESIVNE
jgi:hypothetical protein